MKRTLFIFVGLSFLLSHVCFAVGSTQYQNLKLAKSKQQSPNVKESKLNQVKLQSFDWNGAIPASRLVVLNNPYGSIRSRNHLEKKVFVHATIQEIGDKPVKPEFNIREEQDKLFIDVVYKENIRYPDGQLKGRVDVAILFPGDVNIFAKTDSGMIKIDKTASHVQAESKSGDIKLTTTGLFSAKTESGNISLRMRGFKEFGHAKAQSNSGKISASIFNDMDVDVSADTQAKVLFNGKQKQKGSLYKNGTEVVEVSFQSLSGDISVDVVEPPALVQSVKPSNVNVVNVDIRNLPKSKPWKPGDPVYDRDDKRTNNKKKNDNKNTQN